MQHGQAMSWFVVRLTSRAVGVRVRATDMMRCCSVRSRRDKTWQLRRRQRWVAAGVSVNAWMWCMSCGLVGCGTYSSPCASTNRSTACHRARHWQRTAPQLHVSAYACIEKAASGTHVSVEARDHAGQGGEAGRPAADLLGCQVRQHGKQHRGHGHLQSRFDPQPPTKIDQFVKRFDPQKSTSLSSRDPSLHTVNMAHDTLPAPA